MRPEEKAMWMRGKVSAGSAASDAAFSDMGGLSAWEMLGRLGQMERICRGDLPLDQVACGIPDAKGNIESSPDLCLPIAPGTSQAPVLRLQIAGMSPITGQPLSYPLSIINFSDARSYSGEI